MSIPKKTANDFAVDLENAITTRNPTYDTKIGPIPDVIINPVSNVMELQNDRIRSVQQLLSLVNDGSFTDEDLDEFVYNELIVRSRGSKATVALTFSRLAAPTTDLVVRANFPVATLQDEETGTSITFITTVEATLVAANSFSYFNPSTQRFELTVPAIALVGSTIGNVAPNRITRALRPLVGFDSVYNKNQATGGTDVEINADLIRRYYLSLRGSSPAVPTGIAKILRDKFPSVADSYVVYGNDPLNVRGSTSAGATDVYVIGSSLSTVTENVIFNGVGQVTPLRYQPVSSITSISGYVQGTDYVLEKTSDGNAKSIRASDGPVWLSTATTTPVLYSSITVVYVYNSLLTILQASFDQADTDVIGRDLLFKEGTEVQIALSARLRVRPGYSVSATQSAVVNTIFTMINALLLGEGVEESDIQAVARSFAAVDNFIITLLDRTGGTGAADIAISANEYARIANPNLIITTI